MKINEEEKWTIGNKSMKIKSGYWKISIKFIHL